MANSLSEDVCFENDTAGAQCREAREHAPRVRRKVSEVAEERRSGLCHSGVAAIILATLLQIQGTEVAAEMPLMAAGLDSIATSEMANALA